MKVCFIGLGSIALRHIENMKDLYGDSVTIDVLRSHSNTETSTRSKLINKTYYNYEALPLDYDIIFITNPTRLHFDTLKKCQNHGKHFFIEKPVFMTGEESIKELFLRPDSIYYVACPLRYTNVIQYLKQNIDFTNVYSVRAISSSFLPEWRSGTDYRKSYSSQKELGGGVTIDLIHEWDYLCYLLGRPEKVCYLSGKKSNLEIDSEDIAIYLAEYQNTFVELHLDYFGRVPTRKIELFMENDVIEADLITQRIIFKKNNKVIEMYEERNSYQKKELLYFFELINNKKKNDNSIENACRTLQIARGKIL